MLSPGSDRQRPAQEASDRGAATSQHPLEETPTILPV
jgi:hypothetical protein